MLLYVDKLDALKAQKIQEDREMIQYSWVVTNGKAYSRDIYQGEAENIKEAVYTCLQSLIAIRTLGYWHEYFSIDGETLNDLQLVKKGKDLGITEVQL